MPKRRVIPRQCRCHCARAPRSSGALSVLLFVAGQIIQYLLR
ncbi:hypothetical protein [Saccharothrix syringae]|nr:hypothetical protein [Saccharothrix syringae]